MPDIHTIRMRRQLSATARRFFHASDLGGPASKAGWDKACQFANWAAGQTRACYQPQDREGARLEIRMRVIGSLYILEEDDPES
jgi:hypothetical protein